MSITGSVTEIEQVIKNEVIYNKENPKEINVNGVLKSLTEIAYSGTMESLANFAGHIRGQQLNVKIRWRK
jgi:hypothetical protein